MSSLPYWFLGVGVSCTLFLAALVYSRRRMMQRETAGPDFSRDVRDTIDRAHREARELGGEAVAPEHLLLALLAAPSSPGVHDLQRMGVDATMLRSSLAGTLCRGKRIVTPPDAALPYTARAHQVLRQSMLAAAERQAPETGTSELVLGLLRAGGSEASRVLAVHGVDAAAMRTARTA